VPKPTQTKAPPQLENRHITAHALNDHASTITDIVAQIDIAPELAEIDDAPEHT
jgi:hypothetical protein